MTMREKRKTKIQRRKTKRKKIERRKRNELYQPIWH